MRNDNGRVKVEPAVAYVRTDRRCLVSRHYSAFTNPVKQPDSTVNNKRIAIHR